MGVAREAVSMINGFCVPTDEGTRKPEGQRRGQINEAAANLYRLRLERSALGSTMVFP